jgi:hypothetical protein
MSKILKIKEADLGLTYKKGKTVKVKHKKSGKTLVIVDKPVVKKEYEKIGYYEVKPIRLRGKSGMGKISHLGMESVDEGKVTYKLKGFTNTKMDELDAELSRLGIKGTPDFNKMTYTIHMKGSNSFTLDKIMKKKGGKKIRESVDEYSGMSKWQRDRLDQRSKEKGKKPKKVSKALKKKQDAWAKKYYTKGGGINIAKWKKDGSPAFPKESVNEDRTASIIQHHERELQKYLDKPNKSYRDEEEIQRLRNAIAYAKSKQESVDEDVYIGYYKNKKVKVTAKSSKEAQKQIVKKLRIPKRDYDIASIQNLTKTKQNKHKFESINEKKKMFPPKKMTPKQAKEYKKFIDYAKMGIEYQIDMSLFESVNEVERDYKAEYRKFQSSTKAKKYRAELNKYNRQKGTYGNGDGKDASHKGGKIVGFEAQSKNRGRAEKSRLKKEMVEEVTKGKGVQKIFDIHKNGYGKLGGRMLDSLSAGLFVQLYDKAPDNIKEKMNKMNEKRLYIVIGKMWDKFGKGVKLS